VVFAAGIAVLSLLGLRRRTPVVEAPDDAPGDVPGNANGNANGDSPERPTDNGSGTRT